MGKLLVMAKHETFEEALSEMARILRFDARTPEGIILQIVSDIRRTHEQEVGAIAIAVANDARKDGL